LFFHDCRRHEVGRLRGARGGFILAEGSKLGDFVEWELGSSYHIVPEVRRLQDDFGTFVIAEGAMSGDFAERGTTAF